MVIKRLTTMKTEIVLDRHVGWQLGFRSEMDHLQTWSSKPSPVEAQDRASIEFRYRRQEIISKNALGIPLAFLIACRSCLGI